jgi:hypothetical protein
LHDHLAGILSLATKAKKPLGESGFPVESVKLVARPTTNFIYSLRREDLTHCQREIFEHFANEEVSGHVARNSRFW